MGWFGELSINWSRHAVPQWEMDEISSWYTANLLGNIFFAGKQYVAAGWIYYPVLASGGTEDSIHPWLPITPGCRVLLLHVPAYYAKWSTGESLSVSPTLKGLPGWLGEIWTSLEQKGIKPGAPRLELSLLPSESQYRASASISSTLDSFANLPSPAPNATAPKLNILCGVEW